MDKQPDPDTDAQPPLPLPADAKIARQWLVDENYLNSGHLSAIERIAGTTIDDARREAGLVDSDANGRAAALTAEQQEASDRIKAAVLAKRAADADGLAVIERDANGHVVRQVPVPPALENGHITRQVPAHLLPFEPNVSTPQKAKALEADVKACLARAHQINKIASGDVACGGDPALGKGSDSAAAQQWEAVTKLLKNMSIKKDQPRFEIPKSLTPAEAELLLEKHKDNIGEGEFDLLSRIVAEKYPTPTKDTKQQKRPKKTNTPKKNDGKESSKPSEQQQRPKKSGSAKDDGKKAPVVRLAFPSTCRFLARNDAKSSVTATPTPPAPAAVPGDAVAKDEWSELYQKILGDVAFSEACPEVQVGLITSPDEFKSLQKVASRLGLQVVRHGKATRPVCVAKDLLGGDLMIVRHNNLYLEGPTVEKCAQEMLAKLREWTHNQTDAKSAPISKPEVANAGDVKTQPTPGGTAATMAKATLAGDVAVKLDCAGWVSKRVERDGEKHHITLAHVDDVKAVKMDHVKLLGAHSDELVNDWKCIGLGSAQDAKTGSRAFFAVVDWPSANAWRQRLGLKPNDFHITLAFQKFDVHGVPKDKSTLLS